MKCHYKETVSLPCVSAELCTCTLKSLDPISYTYIRHLFYNHVCCRYTSVFAMLNTELGRYATHNCQGAVSDRFQGGMTRHNGGVFSAYAGMRLHFNCKCHTLEKCTCHAKCEKAFKEYTKIAGAVVVDC